LQLQELTNTHTSSRPSDSMEQIFLALTLDCQVSHMWADPDRADPVCSHRICLLALAPARERRATRGRKRSLCPEPLCISPVVQEERALLKKARLRLGCNSPGSARLRNINDYGFGWPCIPPAERRSLIPSYARKRRAPHEATLKVPSYAWQADGDGTPMNEEAACWFRIHRNTSTR
jgi:hypothetical protein